MLSNHSNQSLICQSAEFRERQKSNYFDDVYKIAKIDLSDIKGAHEAAIAGARAVEVAISKQLSESDLENLRIVRELSYPLPLIARIDEGDTFSHTHLLEKLAFAGVCSVRLYSHSFETARASLKTIRGVNRAKKLGLTIIASLATTSSIEQAELRMCGASEVDSSYSD